MSQLIPEYLNLDFNTFKENIKTQLGNSTTFADYNYEGSNITILIELMAYLSDVHTFLLNKIAKNIYIDTADIYENVHKLARSIGYNAKGHRSARATATITLSEAASGTLSEGDTLIVDAWKEIDSTLSYDGDTITFTTVTQTTSVAPSVDSYPTTFDVEVRQGEVTTLSYTGADIVDNLIILPLYDYGYDNNLDDTYPTVRVVINETEWHRVSDFYDEITSLAYSDNVYMFKYNKYQQYVLEFSSTRNVPAALDNISLTIIKSFGANGSVGSNTITEPSTDFITVAPLIGPAYTLDTSLYTVTNTDASIGAADPEDIATIKENATAFLHTQYRNVTRLDYIANLESRSDITAANVWGEQEIAPSGDTTEYNKVYITLIPDEWLSSTISTVVASAGDYNGLDEPDEYSSAWITELEAYLEPYKMLCTYEDFSLPELIYFSFDIDLRIKPSYTYVDVMTDTRNKLIYYFDKTNREFGETIKFTDISNYILDTTEISSTDSFTNVIGIQNLIIRNIDVNVTTYEPNDINNFPQFTIPIGDVWDENSLRYIDLRYDQFPVLNIDDCTFAQGT